MTQASGEQGMPLRHFRIIGAECVGCGTCEIYIGPFVTRNGPVNRFTRQPQNTEEEAACLEAMAICPTDAIEMIN